jgi:hypothetical protein
VLADERLEPTGRSVECITLGHPSRQNTAMPSNYERAFDERPDVREVLVVGRPIADP